MFGLYFDTFIIRQSFVNMLSILNELTLQKELQTFVTNNVFLTKMLKHNNNKTENKRRKSLPEPGPPAPQLDALPQNHRVN